MKEGQNNDVSYLHKSWASETVSLNHHDKEVEAGEEGSEDKKGAEDGSQADIEKAMEDGAEINLEETTRQRRQGKKIDFDDGVYIVHRWRQRQD